eukprot:g2405.t1
MTDSSGDGKGRPARIEGGDNRVPLLNPSMTSLSRSACLKWTNIDFQVKEKRILRSVSGDARPGRLCAIMGPSGAGKSTLLNCLAGRLEFQGEIYFGGKRIDPKTFRKEIAYVMQEDALFATQTPREAFHFSAALRLPASVSEGERTKLVDRMLTELGLDKCADTYIGSIMISGISGGEKKRTAIGIELISNPKILFLDEPTSGLDSFSAFNVVNILQTLTKRGTTVICTIHQPASEVFHTFDDALLLTEGRLIYHDSVSYMNTYFQALGHRCPDGYNPADFVMFMMQKLSDNEVSTFASDWTKYRATTLSSEEDGGGSKYREDEENAKSAAADDNDEEAPLALSRRHSTNELIESLHRNSDSTRVGVLTQFIWLGIREARSVIRDTGSLLARFGLVIFINTIVGFVFKDAAVWNEENTSTEEIAETLGNHFGAVTQVTIGAMFGLSQPMLLTFPMERPIFLREYATGTYSAIPYFVSKLLVEVPMAIAHCFLIFLITYWLIGFRGDFFVLALCSAMLGLTAASTALVIGSAASNVRVAVQMGPLLFIPQILFAGFFISIQQIPAFMRWAQYLCALKYGLNLLMIEEFKDLPSDWPSDTSPDEYYYAVYGCMRDQVHDDKCDDIVNHSALFPRSDVYVPRRMLYVAILGLVFLAFRTTACVLLTYKASRA